ncbi:hypothetical protein E4T44_04906 [Aureobasidium sp. EXF-8845]|nr:hypothetical protein E4T44_04906 [Aureobasidium sp. EXF-8845]KAI4852131.1 hypothetical protein E4T45_04820 [Aureobasidium sp. EXF-8846]
MSEQPYDPYIPSGQTGGASRDGNQRTAALQAEIDSTVNVMRNNINKVSERGERLDSLQDKTDNLAVSAQGFRRGANRVRKQMWWKDMKMRMCLIVGIILLLVIIIVPSGTSIIPLCYDSPRLFEPTPIPRHAPTALNELAHQGPFADLFLDFTIVFLPLH